MPNQKDRRETSAKRATKVLKSRTLVLAAVLGVATFAALLCRLYYLQIVRHEELQEKAVAQQTRSSTMYFRGNDIKSPHIVILLSFDSIVNTIIR